MTVKEMARLFYKVTMVGNKYSVDGNKNHQKSCGEEQIRSPEVVSYLHLRDSPRRC